MRKEFRMNDDQYAFMMAAMKDARNQRVMYLSGGRPMFDDPQEIANIAWKKLADEMKFVWDSAGAGADDHSFIAEEK
jgi:aspartate/methionine/tyrosine aminotransferase